MNPGSFSNLVRVNPAVWLSRALIHRGSRCDFHPASSSPSSPTRSTPHPQRRRSQPSNGDPSRTDLVPLPPRGPFATVARAIGSSTGGDVNVNSSVDADNSDPPPEPSSSSSEGRKIKTTSDLLDEALKSTAASPQAEIVIADSCVRRLKEIDEPRLRVIVEGGGCSGFQYKFELDVEVDPEADRVFEKDGVQVVVDGGSLDYVRGSVVEFQTELIRSAFRIGVNPLAEKGCSCGASFSVKF